MRFRSLRAVATALSLAIGLAAVMPLAHAEKADRNKPINYSADTGDVNIQTKVGTLTGNVVITQGTLTIRADKVVFRQNADNTLSATAHGNPVSFRQKRDGVEEYYEGFAQRGEYDGSKDLLQLYERALLRRGGDEIRSNYISYNTGTELFKAEGRASAAPVAGEDNTGARVRGVFQPKGEAPGKPDGKGAPGKTAGPPVSLKSAGEVAPSTSR